MTNLEVAALHFNRLCIVLRTILFGCTTGSSPVRFMLLDALHSRRISASLNMPHIDLPDAETRQVAATMNFW